MGRRVVITASDLLMGDVVYLGVNRRWHRYIDQAALFETSLAAKAALSEPDAAVIGPYLINVATCPDGPPQPIRLREEFRARGPSNRFLGKQAEGRNQDSSDVRL